MRFRAWSSDVCSSDLVGVGHNDGCAMDLPAREHNARCAPALDEDPGDGCTQPDFAAALTDSPYQCVGEGLRSTGRVPTTVEVITEDRGHGGRGELTRVRCEESQVGTRGGR